MISEVKCEQKRTFLEAAADFTSDIFFLIAALPQQMQWKIPEAAVRLFSSSSDPASCVVHCQPTLEHADPRTGPRKLNPAKEL